ncbi:MAG: FtsX-like permease family protein [Acidobacteriia bacterium]|nr:FtsX-like permease family protein [Terriglobia bacterium]
MTKFIIAALAAALSVVSAAATDTIPAVLVSRQLAEGARLHVGDIVTIALDAQGHRGKRFRVAGIYEPTPDPMKFTARRIEARMHLPDLIDVAGAPADAESPDAVDAINIRLADPNDTRAFSASVMARAPGIFARSTARAEDGSDPFAVLDRFHFAIAIVTVFGSTAFLLALMVMRAEERRETVGIVRLIGISQRSILLEVLVEGLLIATAGAIFGVLFALATQGAINRFFQWRYDTALVFVRVTTRIALESVALAVPLGIAAGLVGSWTLLRRDVVALVRR